MTEGSDGPTDDGVSDSRDPEDGSRGGRNRPRPGGSGSDDRKTRRGDGQQRPDEGGEREHIPERATELHDEGTETVPAEARPRAESGEVDVADRVGGDGSWVDLGKYSLRGEALAASDLSKEKIQEYTTDRRSLSPLVQVHWGLRITVGGLVAGLVATWGLRSLDIDAQWGGVVVGALVLVGLVWVVVHYQLWGYKIRTDAIYLERGVVTHVRTLVPYVRIQHVDTSRSPIERMLGLSTLVVYTAGSRGADVSIPGLKPDEARDLQRRVKELAIEAEGDDAL